VSGSQRHGLANQGARSLSPMDSKHAGALAAFHPDIWLGTDPVRIVGMKLSATMAIVKLPDSELLVFSPTAMTPRRRAAVEALGDVTHLYAPNTFHFRWLAEWAEAFPRAKVHAPRGLASKRPELRIDRFHDEGLPDALASVLDEVHIEGFLLEESVLVHRPSGTLLVADLVHNIGRPEHWWAAVYSRAMGFYNRVAISRVLRWTAFRDPEATRSSLERLAAVSFDRLVVGHGAPLVQGAHQAVLDAYTWIPRKQTLQRSGMHATPGRGFCG
jgi:hypothetical protein